MKSILEVISLGVIPTYMVLKNFGWLWWLGYVILLVILLIAFSMVHAIWLSLDAAHNIVMAKATILTLNKTTRRRAEIYAKRIYSVHKGDPDANFDNDIEKSAYLALAMKDMDIAPVVLFDEWLDVKNPSDIPSYATIAHVMKRVAKQLQSTPGTND